MKIFLLAMVLAFVNGPMIDMHFVPDPYAPALVQLSVDRPAEIDPRALVCRALADFGLSPPIGFEVYRRGATEPTLYGTVEDCRERL